VRFSLLVAAVAAGLLTTAAAPAAAAPASPRIVVSRHGHAALGGGLLTFQTTAGATVRPTRVVSQRKTGRGVVEQFATDDPEGRGVHVRISYDGHGIAGVHATITGGPTDDVTRMGVSFASPKDERFYGLGERSTAVDQRGQDVENYASDGPWPESNYTIASATIPPQGFRARPDSTYFPMPWLLSSRGYGFLLDNAEPSEFHLGTSPRSAWSVDAQAASLTFRVFAGPTPAAALRRFTAATGRQPPPTAAWQFGPWFQTGQPNTVPLDQEADWLRKLRAADAPVSAAETQLRYLPCGLDRGNEDYEAQRVAFFHQQGLAILTYVNPMLCASYAPLYDQATSAGALQVNASGANATFSSFVGGVGSAGFTIQPVAQFDFTSPAGAQVYRTVLQRVVDAGHDGWMEDFGEYTPTDTRPRDATSPAAMHNTYPTTYHCAVANLIGQGLSPRPLVRFQRSGWTGSARCASDVWGGDPTTQFGFDGLSSAVIQALGIGMSGVSRWGSDIGGYDTLGDDPQLTPELLSRWIEFGAVSGVMRTKASGLAIPGYQRPEIWDPGIVEVWRRYAKLHTQLYPYLLAADAEYRRTGMPLMRALVLEAPRDRAAQRIQDEFGFGPDVLAAPVVTEGATSRRVHLPPGRWIDFNQNVDYDRKNGGYDVTGGKTIAGPDDRKVAARLDTLPLFVRAGAVLPLLAPDVSTLAGYGSGGVVHLRDREDRLRLLAFPTTHPSSSHAYEHDRFVSSAHGGTWTLRVDGSRRRRYDLEAATAGLGGDFEPCRVTLDGKRVKQWSYRHAVLRATFSTTAGVLQVDGRCGTLPGHA
jgi:alpha-glucosidase (family GH31 glycosyl hydrolase)